jgi:hypothetical protein
MRLLCSLPGLLGEAGPGWAAACWFAVADADADASVLNKTWQPCAARVCASQAGALCCPAALALTPAAALPPLQVKRDTARARNDLESYIISMREKMESDELIAKVGGGT